MKKGTTITGLEILMFVAIMWATMLFVWHTDPYTASSTGGMVEIPAWTVQDQKPSTDWTK